MVLSGGCYGVTWPLFTHLYFFYSRWLMPSTVVEKIGLKISCPFWIPPTSTIIAERDTPRGDNDITCKTDILESHVYNTKQRKNIFSFEIKLYLAVIKVESTSTQKREYNLLPFVDTDEFLWRRPKTCTRHNMATSRQPAWKFSMRTSVIIVFVLKFTALDVICSSSNSCFYFTYQLQSIF